MRTYVKPVLVRSVRMDFPFLMLQAVIGVIACRQCSSCHACRG